MSDSIFGQINTFPLPLVASNTCYYFCLCSGDNKDPMAMIRVVTCYQPGNRTVRLNRGASKSWMSEVTKWQLTSRHGLTTGTWTSNRHNFEFPLSLFLNLLASQWNHADCWMLEFVQLVPLAEMVSQRSTVILTACNLEKSLSSYYLCCFCVLFFQHTHTLPSLVRP